MVNAGSGQSHYLFVIMDENELIKGLGLSNVKGIGISKLKKLIQHFGSPELVFSASENELRKSCVLGESTLKHLLE
ncbi:MAG: hypothetical protein AAF193_01480, partial [Bacteroidota bacterium]